MEAIRKFVPEGLPVSVQVIGVTILLSIIYSFVTKNRPWPAFPLISIRGLGPRKSWMYHSLEVIEEGLKKVCLPRQL